MTSLVVTKYKYFRSPRLHKNKEISIECQQNVLITLSGFNRDFVTMGKVIP